jgi:hypothetical protein
LFSEALWWFPVMTLFGLPFFLGTPAHRSKFEADLQQTARQRGAGEVSWFSQVLMMTPLFLTFGHIGEWLIIISY